MTHPAYLTEAAITQFIRYALKEDIGEGDHSTLSTVPFDNEAKAKLLVKEDGILAGVELAERIFHYADPSLKLEIFKKDGDAVAKGDIAFEVFGKARAILTTERLVLNCMQRMSGIATKTIQLSKLIEGTSAKLMDTRKTTPNFRLMEKWAVAIGGGKNHRFALYDMIILKKNHIDVAGGISLAVANTGNYFKEKKKKLFIEIENRNLKERKELLNNET